MKTPRQCVSQHETGSRLADAVETGSIQPITHFRRNAVSDWQPEVRRARPHDEERRAGRVFPPGHGVDAHLTHVEIERGARWRNEQCESRSVVGRHRRGAEAARVGVCALAHEWRSIGLQRQGARQRKARAQRTACRRQCPTTDKKVRRCAQSRLTRQLRNDASFLTRTSSTRSNHASRPRSV
jgi:hypothetical protein